jgi:hypothetical protein
LRARSGDTAAAQERFQDILRTQIGKDGRQLKSILDEALRKRKIQVPKPPTARH